MRSVARCVLAVLMAAAAAEGCGSSAAGEGEADAGDVDVTVDTSEGDTDDASALDDTGTIDTTGPDSEADTPVLGETGEVCDDDDQCASGFCVDVFPGDDGAAGFCSQQCNEDADCPRDFDCVLFTDTGTDSVQLCVAVDLCLDEDEDDYGFGPGCLGRDCDDGDATVNPRADEVCDGVDNDCDGEIDDNPIDANLDCDSGFEGVCAEGRTVCEEGIIVCASRIAPVDETCNDIDDDCDGLVDRDPDGGDLVRECYDADPELAGIGVCRMGRQTCTDGGFTGCIGQVIPTAEVCDELDNDCDGAVDEGVGSLVFWIDADGDGFGEDGSAPQVACARPSGYADNDDDCNDADPSVHPDAGEVPGDGVDQNCDGIEFCYADGDADGYRPNATLTTVSIDPDCDDPGEARFDGPVGDCNDSDATVHPGATEGVADAEDQDCDGIELCYVDADSDGYRADGGATVASDNLACTDPGEGTAGDPEGDCDDGDRDRHPDAPELCDMIDNDCDGAEDEEVAFADFYPDMDGDGFGAIDAMPMPLCDGGGDFVTDHSDCDDGDPDVHPGATETVDDGIDQNCVAGDLCYLDADDDGWRPNTTSTRVSDDLDCDDPGEATTADPVGDCDDADPARNPDAVELTDDGVDQNCDTEEICFVDADGDGHRPDATTTVVSTNLLCTDFGEGSWGDPADDCDDTRADVFPGRPEICNDGADNDCDGTPNTCALSGTIGLGTADAKLLGPAQGDTAGWSVSAAGDLDGDDLDDVVVGAPTDADGRNDNGTAFAYLDVPTGDVILSSAAWSGTGEGDGDEAGFSVAILGDVNGDDLDDFAVGAPDNDRGGSNAGAAYIVFGAPSGTISLTSADVIITGINGDDELGWQVSSGGDFNGDGLADILVGARLDDTAHSSNPGAAYLILGAEDLGGVIDLETTAAAVILLGETSDDQLGRSVAGGGDLNHDGFDDLVVGAPRNNTTGNDRGALYVIYGTDTPPGVVDGTMADAIIYGDANGRALGYSVSIAGDVNGDGFDDILAGSPEYWSNHNGYCYLIPGPVAAGTHTVTDLAIATFHGEADGDNLGVAVSIGGDVNGDGYDDLLMGAEDNDEAATNAGAAYLIYGPVTGSIELSSVSADVKFLGQSGSNYAGRGLTLGGDIDGDGLDEIFVGATHYDQGSANNRGAVYVFFGRGL